MRITNNSKYVNELYFIKKYCNINIFVIHGIYVLNIVNSFKYYKKELEIIDNIHL